MLNQFQENELNKKNTLPETNIASEHAFPKRK